MRSHHEKVARFYGSGISRYTSPHNVNHNSLSFGLWNQYAVTYRQAAEDLCRCIAECGLLNDKSQLLDVGCGLGFGACYWMKKYHPQKIDGLDVTPQHITLSRELVEEEKKRGTLSPAAKIEFHEGNAVDYPFAAELFTHVFACESPPHMNTRADFFRNAYRMLKPGGVLVCTDLILKRPPKNLAERMFTNLGIRAWRVPKANMYDSEVLKSHVVHAGFADFKIEFIGGAVIPDYYKWHRRKDQVRAMRKHRGTLKGVWGGYIIDRILLEAYQRELCEYVIYAARKPQ